MTTTKQEMRSQNFLILYSQLFSIRNYFKYDIIDSVMFSAAATIRLWEAWTNIIEKTGSF